MLMKKEHAWLLKKAVRENGGKDWGTAREDIYWDYVSKDKPAFTMTIGETINDEECGHATMIKFVDHLGDCFLFDFFGSDNILCSYRSIEEAIPEMVKRLVHKANYLY